MGVKNKLAKLNYYQLLGVKKGADVEEIRRGYHLFALKYHPDNHLESAPHKVAKATTVFRRGAEAYRVLCDPIARRKYDRGLIDGKRRLTTNDGVKGTSIRPSAVPDRELKHPEARKYLEMALQALSDKDLKNAKLYLSIAQRHAPKERKVIKALAQLQRAERDAQRKS